MHVTALSLSWPSLSAKLVHHLQACLPSFLGRILIVHLVAGKVRGGGACVVCGTGERVTMNHQVGLLFSEPGVGKL